jgi:NifU-like N terminal domain
MKYSELTLHYFQTAPATGVLTGPDAYRGAAGNRAQGTWVQFDLRVSGGIIHAARFLAFACPHTIAATAWVAEHAGGPLSRTTLPGGVQDLSERFAVPPEKRGRLLIIEDAWVAAATSALQR